jgi:O-antigen/teichoic acid export membrane protein
VRRHIALTFVQKHLQMLVSIGSVMILSRLISPEETGIFSIGVAIAALTHAIRDFGVGNFLVKETEITALKVQTAFTISLMIAILLSIVLVAASFPVAAFYAKPEVATIIWITTLGLLISPFSTVNMALMLRKHRFGGMLKVSMASAITNAAVAIGLAWLGFGAKSLAFGALASSVVLVIVSNLLANEQGIYRFSLKHWRQISNFGMHMTVFGVTEQLGQRASDLIVGKLVGFTAVGLLSRSGTLITMVQDSIQNSVMPVILTNMAGDTRKSGDVMPLLLTSLQYLTVVLWPIFAVIALCAHDAVFVLFGPKWIEAAPFTSILCMGAAFAVLSSLTGTICNATDRADLLSRYSTFGQGMRVALIATGAVIGGLKSVVLMLVLAEGFQCILAYIYVRRTAPISVLQLARVCWRSLAVTALVSAIVFPVQLLAAPSFLRLVLTAIAATIAWIAAVFIVRHPVAAEVRMLSGVIGARLRTT